MLDKKIFFRYNRKKNPCGFVVTYFQKHAKKFRLEKKIINSDHEFLLLIYLLQESTQLYLSDIY